MRETVRGIEGCESRMCERYGTQIAGCVENEEDEKGEMQANVGVGIQKEAV